MYSPVSVRSNLFALITALEIDVRDCLLYYGITVEEVLPSLKNKNRNESIKPETEIRELLELSDFGDLSSYLNIVKKRLDESSRFCCEYIAKQINDTVNIRNRVHHSRTLHEQDSKIVNDFCHKLRDYKTTFYNFVNVEKALSGEFQPRLCIEPSSSRIAHNLPLPDFDDTTFIGRVEERKNLKDKLLHSSHPVFTIIGQGGVGKTAFVIQCLYELIEEETNEFDVIVWTSFKKSKLTDKGIEEIEEEFDLLTEISRSEFNNQKHYSIQSIVDQMKSVKTLLVLDNLETLNADDANLRYLVENVPKNSKVLITSRIGMENNESRFELAPLKLDECYTLFQKYSEFWRLDQNKFNLSPQKKKEICEKNLFCNPLLIKWYITSIANGFDQTQLVKKSTSLNHALHFCLSNIIEHCSEVQINMLLIMKSLESDSTLGQIRFYIKEIFNFDDIDEVNKQFNKLNTSGFFSVRRDYNSSTDYYTINPMVNDFISLRNDLTNKHEDIFKKITEKQKKFRQENQTNTVSDNTYLYMIERVSLKNSSPDSNIVRHTLREVLSLFSTKNPANMERAVAELERHTQDFPNVSESFRILGFFYGTLNNLSKAKECYEHALELDPENTLILYTFSKFLDVKLEDFESALKYIEKALMIDSNTLALKSMQALYKNRLGRISEAQNHYLEILEILPKEMSPSYYKVQIIDQAIDTFRRSSETYAKLRDEKNFNLSLREALNIFQKGIDMDLIDRQTFKRLSQIIDECLRHPNFLERNTLDSIRQLVDENKLVTQLDNYTHENLKKLISIFSLNLICK